MMPPPPRIAYWLALLRAPGIGATTYHQILQRYATPEALFRETAAEGDLPRQLAQYLRSPDWAGVEADLRWAEDPDCHIITLHDEHYPPLLRQIAAAPPLLFVAGDPHILHRPQLAIVGSRNPSATGRETAWAFAKHLSVTGLTITSGLALGIDAASHHGALSGRGGTIAVTGTGLDRVYPAQHLDLSLKIRQQGAVVSELPSGSPPRPEHFPRRNRIISGMSLGTLVVEAALGSGSLITARLAAEQGREVFAIPGSIHNPLARGCHALIRDGAKLVETAQDILEELSHLTEFSAQTVLPLETQRQDTHLSHDLGVFLNHLGYEPTAIDALVERSGLTTERVSSMLLLLELQGLVVAAPGGLYTRIQKGV